MIELLHLLPRDLPVGEGNGIPAKSGSTDAKVGLAPPTDRLADRVRLTSGTLLLIPDSVLCTDRVRFMYLLLLAVEVTLVRRAQLCSSSELTVMIFALRA